jgi:hypothetical protein
MKMRTIVIVIFTVSYLGCFIQCQGRGPNSGPRNLVLTEQELKFAGTALRAALTSNSNSYVSIGNMGAARRVWIPSNFFDEVPDSSG